MKKIIALILLVVLTLFIMGCQNRVQTTGYATAPQQQPQHNPYYGQGCGVAPVDNAETPVEASAISANL
jgi:uncharacterized lipoprotein NlpE involved in copper resistance|tara:strand:- start:249 stop:455 length:207 start_codon:yes stop_codon:yes gene_type:complete